MKLKEQLAIDAVESRDLISNENRKHYGEGFIAGFEKAREMAAKIAYSSEFDGTGDAIDFIGEEEVD